IVQEAADEDANIIFGAVVDPALKGKVKITVIATGFALPVGSARPSASSAQTPVDLTPFAELTRARPEAAASFSAERASTRMSIARRPLLDIPIAAAAAAGA